MYDRQTVSLWIHTTGAAVIGDLQGKILDFVPSVVTTWNRWRTEHPQTLVLNVKKGSNPRFTLRTNPKAGSLSVGEPDAELRFYPFPTLQEQRVINGLWGTNVTDAGLKELQKAIPKCKIYR